MAPCMAQDNVVFIKTHKTGSTSLGHIVNRYGHLRNLSFVFNRRCPRNGHLVYLPLNASSPRDHFLPPIGVQYGNFSGYKYSMLAVHVRYDRAAMDAFMLPNTRYITIIRDPVAQFESAFAHFQFDDSFPKEERRKFSSTQARLAHFMIRPDHYWARLKTLKWEKVTGLRWYYARNNQVFDLGLDHMYHNDSERVQEHIEELDREFDLVLITEYFEESLLVMKRVLCWETEDILYIAKNVRQSHTNVKDDVRRDIRKWNAVDVKLYEHFNQSLWRKISEYGPSFEVELDEFRKRLNETDVECVGSTKMKSHGHYFQRVEKIPRQNSSELCELIAETKFELFSKIWRKQAVIKYSSKNVNNKKKSASRPQNLPRQAKKQKPVNIKAQLNGTQ